MREGTHQGRTALRAPDIDAAGQCAVGCRTEAARRDYVREVRSNLEQFGIAIQSLEEIHGVVAGVPNLCHSIVCHLVLDAQRIGFTQWLAEVRCLQEFERPTQGCRLSG